MIGRRRNFLARAVSVSLMATPERPRFALHRRTSLDPRPLESPHEEVLEVICRWGTETLCVLHLRGGERFALGADGDPRAADSRDLDEARVGASTAWVDIQQRAGRWRARYAASDGGEPRELVIEHDTLAAFALGPLDVGARQVTAGRAAARSRVVDRVTAGAFAGGLLVILAALGLAKARHDRDEALAWDPLVERSAGDGALLRGLLARTNGPARPAPPEPLVAPRSAGLRGAPDAIPVGGRSMASESMASRSMASESMASESMASRSMASRSPGANGGDRPWVRRARRAREPAPGSLARTGVLAALGSPTERRPVHPWMDGSLPERATDRLSVEFMGRDPAGDVVGLRGLGQGLGTGRGASGDSSERRGCAGGSAGCEHSEIERASDAVRDRALALAAGPLRERRTGVSRVCGGTVATCAPTVSEGLYAADRIRRIVRRNLGAFERCFEQSLARNAAREGRVSVRFELDGDGSTRSVGVEHNNTGDGLLGACVARVFGRLRFDPPSNTSVIVSYPMTFASE
jgi:hypothetical protein